MRWARKNREKTYFFRRFLNMLDDIFAFISIYIATYIAYYFFILSNITDGYFNALTERFCVNIQRFLNIRQTQHPKRNAIEWKSYKIRRKKYKFFFSFFSSHFFCIYRTPQQVRFVWNVDFKDLLLHNKWDSNIDVNGIYFL